MDPVTVGILGVVLVFVLLFIGMPIAFALMLTGFLGISYLSSVDAALPVVARTVWEVSSHYSYTVIPLFIVMGGFAGSSGLTRDMYGAFEKWSRRMPGGLGIATIGACAGFAAVSGSSVATAATMGTVALPEMKRYQYDPKLATGCVAAGGSLGILIPPSVVFIVYGIMTQQSIGKLFVAGILPGVLLTLSFIVDLPAAHVMAAGHDPGFDALRDPGFDHEVSDLGLDPDQIAGSYPDPLPIRGVEPEGIGVGDLVQPLGVGAAGMDLHR